MYVTGSSTAQRNLYIIAGTVPKAYNSSHPLSKASIPILAGTATQSLQLLPSLVKIQYTYSCSTTPIPFQIQYTYSCSTTPIPFQIQYTYSCGYCHPKLTTPPIPCQVQYTYSCGTTPIPFQVQYTYSCGCGNQSLQLLPSLVSSSLGPCS